MYIAIVADNVADRKQLERLMDRTNDSIKDIIDQLYVDSFGNIESATMAPMKYNLFILDFTIDHTDYEKMILTLKDHGAPGLVSVCRPDGEKLEIENTYPELWHIDKPIRQEALDLLVTEAYGYTNSHTTAKLEIRTKEETHYIDPKSVYYAKFDGSVNSVLVEDGTIYEHYGDFNDLCETLMLTGEFVVPKKNIIVNKVYIVDSNRLSVTLFNGEKINRLF